MAKEKEREKGNEDCKGKGNEKDCREDQERNATYSSGGRVLRISQAPKQNKTKNGNVHCADHETIIFCLIKLHVTHLLSWVEAVSLRTEVYTIIRLEIISDYN